MNECMTWILLENKKGMSGHHRHPPRSASAVKKLFFNIFKECVGQLYKINVTQHNMTYVVLIIGGMFTWC